MCHRLFQVLACGHQKIVCTTPCPHAIASGRQLPQHNDRRVAELARSVSVVSSTTPTAPTPVASRIDVQNPSGQRQSQVHASPLRVVISSTQEQRQSGIQPAFHFVASAPEPLSPPPTYSSDISAAPLAQTSPSTASLQKPSPTWSTAGTLVNAPSTLFTPADPEVNGCAVEPNFCDYYFPRHLPRGVAPCRRCYLKSEWDMLRRAWMKVYRDLHPGVKEEDLEKLTGIAGVRERVGGLDGAVEGETTGERHGE